MGVVNIAYGTCINILYGISINILCDNLCTVETWMEYQNNESIYKRFIKHGHEKKVVLLVLSLLGTFCDIFLFSKGLTLLKPTSSFHVTL